MVGHLFYEEITNDGLVYKFRYDDDDKNIIWVEGYNGSYNPIMMDMDYNSATRSNIRHKLGCQKSKGDFLKAG